VTLYDTTSITIYDTISLAIHDTTIITLYDTTYLYDTTIITNTVYDTTIITQYDTTYINNYIHDTTVVTNTVYDTTIITQYDTTYINNYIHDTTIVTNTVYDTTIITQYDTTYINNYIHDTTIVTNTVYDTTYITQYDTTYINLYIYDTITITDTITIPLETYNLSVISSNTQQGVAAGNGEFPEGTEVEIAAIPLEGHTFVSWSDGVIENPRTITLTCDSTFTATFGTVGTESTLPYSFQIYAHHDVIVVENANGNRIRIFDAVGRILATQMVASSTFQYQVPSSGVYLIQVGNYPARKLTIVR
ncbi:MAG: DUF6383 domain-containing protein, partial [Bacteroidales bacterium]|nr:DUF6383 domain-containing protein [Bacteroidales bacterium]